MTKGDNLQSHTSPDNKAGRVFFEVVPHSFGESELIFDSSENLLHKVIPGVDIVEISRIKKIIEKWGEKFLHRVFTDDELNYCLGKSGTPSHLAGRFAAKEAVIKLLKGEKSPDLRSIEICRGKNGEPLVRLRNEAVEMAKMRGIHFISVSITHSGDFAAAFAIGESG